MERALSQQYGDGASWLCPVFNNSLTVTAVLFFICYRISVMILLGRKDYCPHRAEESAAQGEDVFAQSHPSFF